MSIRDVKRQAREDLHQAMQVPALYLLSNPSFDGNIPEDPDTNPRYLATPVNVRTHYSFKALGDMKGTNFHFAEMTETQPRIVFWREELDNIERNAIVSVEVGEAYRIDHPEPPDDQTRSAVCLKLTVAEATGLPVPETL